VRSAANAAALLLLLTLNRKYWPQQFSDGRRSARKALAKPKVVKRYLVIFRNINL
jgi:hypothetical protein